MTGDPADMMFGTYVMAQCVLDPEGRAWRHPHKNKNKGKINPLYMKLEERWEIFAEFMVFKGLLSPKAKSAWLQWIKPFVAKSPIPVVTVFDFLWWCSYALKYQHDEGATNFKLLQCRLPEKMKALLKI